MKKIVAIILSTALILSLIPLSVFSEGEIVSISYNTVYREFVENSDGEWDNYGNYFRYYCNFIEWNNYNTCKGNIKYGCFSISN